MNNARFAILFLLIAAGTAAAQSSYHLTFDDEFNAFNGDRWQTADFWGMRHNGGDFQGQWFADPKYVPEKSDQKPYNAFIPGNGTLAIRAQPTPIGIYSGLTSYSKSQPHVSGQLTSAHKFTQRYGYYELRAKLPPGKGLWSRFWLLTDDGIWPGEYDVFEVVGRENPSPVHQTTHYRNAVTEHGMDGVTYAGINAADGKFHTYGFLWEPKTVSWYVDGVRTAIQENRINTPMYVLIDLAVGNDPPTTWPGSPDKTTPWPADMELDYYRVYSNDPSLPSVTPDAGYTPSVLPEGLQVKETAKAAQLPSGWSAADLAPTPTFPGSSTWNSATGEWMLKATSYADGNLQFASTPLVGEGAIVATVLSQTSINQDTIRSGVMIRDGSRGSVSLLQTHLAFDKTTTNGLIFQASGSINATTVTVPNISLPVTLRLIRSGNTLTGAYSTDDGLTWTDVGSATGTKMGELQAGIVQGGDHGTRKLARSTICNVSVGESVLALAPSSRSLITGEATTFSARLTNPLTGATIPAGPVKWSVVSGGGTIDENGKYTAPPLVGTGTATIKAVIDTYSVTRSLPVTLPDAWTIPTLVNTPPGDAGRVSGIWTVVGGGAGISTDGGRDSFRFVSSVVNGNHTVNVKVNDSDVKGMQAGLVIRDATRREDAFAGAGGRYAGIWLTGTGLQWATRESAGGKAESIAQLPTPPTPVWLRHIRSGAACDVFAAYYSTDGKIWTQLGNSRKFTMTVDAQVGLAVASGTRLTTALATFSDLRVSSDQTASASSRP